MREVICISSGDSRKVSTWSGIPFFHTKSLENKGLIVHRVDIGLQDWKVRLYDITIRRFYKIFYRNTSIDAYHSFLSYIRLSYLVLKNSIKYKKADCIIIYSYSPFCHKLTKKPVIALCDWTFEYFLKTRLAKSPDLLEQRYIRLENNSLVMNSGVISLFDNCADYIRQNTGARVFHIEGNVINAFEEPEEIDIIKKKTNRRILFIGRSHYLRGLELLLEAFNELKEEYQDLRLDIIGLNSEVVDKELNKNIYFHGFLRKENPEQSAKFYELIREATVVVNPNPKWAGYSSLMEAMYFYTPIITSPFESFVRDFGQEIDFGEYCDENNVANKIRYVLDSDNYHQMCMSAHERVKNFTWDNYVTRFLEIVSMLTS